MNARELSPDQLGDTLQQAIVDAIRTVYDPEIPVNLYDLGLIYDIKADDYSSAEITMTLTTPACPVAQTMPGKVEDTVRELTGIEQVKVNLVWDPPWTREAMNEEARLALNLM